MKTPRLIQRSWAWVERRPAWQLLLWAGLVWVLVTVFVAPLGMLGYSAALLWYGAAPTGICLLLLARSVWRETSAARRWRRHAAWLCTLAWILANGVATNRGYGRMDDAPRGLLWVFYGPACLVAGTAVYWTVRGLAGAATGLWRKLRPERPSVTKPL